VNVTFIEASAGTGKTYALVQRVVELVRRGVPAEAILLVTFTERATDELKTRIRRGLREAYLAETDERLAQRLAQSFEDWSSLTIATIHGFCRLILTRFPLESGVSFEPEVVDEREQARRLLRDELRPRLTSLGTLPEWAGLEDEEELLKLASNALHDGVFEKPLLHPDAGETALFDRLTAALEAGTGELWQALRALPRGLPEDAKGLAGAELLNGSTSKVPYRRVRALAQAASWRDLRACLNDDDLEYLLKWESAAWKKNADPPASGVLAEVRSAALALAEVVAGLERQAGVPLAAFLERAARFRLLDAFVRSGLDHTSNRELTFRDLVDRTKKLAVSGALAGAARRWKAVLIDEFQDTDDDQWTIFSKLFLREDCELTVVGDPKQSIYRFRGADLDVYRAAREQVAPFARFEVLDRNFRSTAAMIDAVNERFDPARAAWPRATDFTPSRKGERTVAILKQAGAELPAVEALRAESEADWHRHLVAKALALLSGGVLEGETSKPVDPADMMVLVRRNREAETVARLLQSKGIPVSVNGTGGLLATREAGEIVLFLKALEAPGSLSAARALAWTRLLAGADPGALAVALQAAQQDRQRGAFLRAFRRVAAALDGHTDGGGLETLLSRQGGARAVTDAEHVLELMQDRFHRGEVPHGQAALSLERWIESQRQEDEIAQRRDTDSPVVRVLTIHAAKGLEAPIVLHGWPDAPRKRDPDWILWGGAAGGVDFLLTDAGRAAEAANEAAEALRLRYVALTRAQSHQMLYDENGAPLTPWTAAAWDALPRWTPPPSGGPSLGDAVRGLEGRHPWVESHSGLWRRSQGSDDSGTAWDRPRAPRDSETNEPESFAEQLPAGPAFGDLVHDVLERADWRGWAPGADDALKTETSRLVDAEVQRHRLRLPAAALARNLDRWLGRVLPQPLDLGAAGPIRFTDLSPEDTRRELEFHLPLAHAEPRVFVWGGREFTVHPGYLTGRIDVLFRWKDKLYLADWKTNRLGDQTPEAVMAESGYDLQAQWYWQALNRLCRVQNEPLAPGGVLYVFLRGAGDKPEGVFLPPETLSSRKTLTPFLEEAAHG